VVDGARLESVYTGNRIVGSNPTPSANSSIFYQCYQMIKGRLIGLLPMNFPMGCALTTLDGSQVGQGLASHHP
jgi:hypothetical protein